MRTDKPNIERANPTDRVLAHFDELPADALGKLPVVQALAGGISDESVRRYVKSGRLPRPVKLGLRLNGWRVGELRAALAALQGEA
jgi:predicted DNA-binding transcriptional regulator AlpA